MPPTFRIASRIMEWVFSGIPHFDVLHFSRRQWKDQFPSLRLSALEREILGITRNDDVPGQMVPEFYETYLRTGNCGPLVPIVEHNRQDVVSLALLFFHLLGESLWLLLICSASSRSIPVYRTRIVHIEITMNRIPPSTGSSQHLFPRPSQAYLDQKGIRLYSHQCEAINHITGRKKCDPHDADGKWQDPCLQSPGLCRCLKRIRMPVHCTCIPPKHLPMTSS